MSTRCNKHLDMSTYFCGSDNYDALQSLVLDNPISWVTKQAKLT